MQKVRVSSRDIRENKVFISNKEQLHHLKNVLRLKLKEKVEVFDELGRRFLCLVEELTPELTFRIIDFSKRATVGSRPHLTIACAIPKKSNMDDIIDKLTQLGVGRIIPLEAKRVIVRLNDEKKKMRLERWKKIALNAAQQSQRGILPVIEPVQGLSEVLKNSAGYGLKLIPHLEGERKTLKQEFREKKFKSILVLIGPEGDFSPEEVRSALEAGFIPVTLGDLVLRVETAAVAVASFILLNEEN